MLFSRDVAVGGHKLTEDIKNLQSVEYLEAEEMKRTKGLGAFLGGEGDAETSIKISRRKALDSLVTAQASALRPRFCMAP